MKLTRENRWKWYVSKIDNIEEATQAFGIVRKDWYGMAGLIIIGYTILSYLATISFGFLIDASIFLLVGYFLPITKSRTLAVLMLIYCLASCFSTFACVLGISSGGRNIVLAILVSVIAYKGVQASFIFHKFNNSKTCWKNVFISWSIVIAFMLLATVLGFIISGVVSVFYKSWMSEEALGAFIVVPPTIAIPLGFLLTRKKFPMLQSNVPSA